MKILILGGDGMIGHKMDQVLSVQNHEIVISIREKKDLTLKSISSKSKVFFNDFLKDNILDFLDKVNPDIIINACKFHLPRLATLHPSKGCPWRAQRGNGR